MDARLGRQMQLDHTKYSPACIDLSVMRKLFLWKKRFLWKLLCFLEGVFLKEKIALIVRDGKRTFLRSPEDCCLGGRDKLPHMNLNFPLDFVPYVQQ